MAFVVLWQMTIAEGLNFGDLIGSQMPLHRTLDVCVFLVAKLH